MRVLVFHGWLLRGTGSNVYNASLATALARLGHEVHLVCQDRDVRDLAPADAPGSVTIHNPDIGGLLPVFVRDSYEGFEVKTFSELTDAELERYIELNVAAVEEIVLSLGGVDAALANHLIMAPVILARGGLPYALKVHGSDLSYTVLPDLERFGALRPRGLRRRRRDPRRLLAHSRPPPRCGRRAGDQRQGPPRPPGSRHRAVRPCPRRRGPPPRARRPRRRAWRARSKGHESRGRGAGVR